MFGKEEKNLGFREVKLFFDVQDLIILNSTYNSEGSSKYYK